MLPESLRPDSPRARRQALPVELRRSLGVVAIIAALGVVALAVLHAGRSTPGVVDSWVESAVRGGLFAARSVAVLIDLVGEPHVLPVVLAVLGGLCLASGHPRLAALAVAGPLVSGAGTTILKPVVGRTINGDHLAFPSGHTAVATAIALVVALLVIGLLRPGWVGAMLLFLTAAAVAGTAMAWSQVLLDAHYATDALGGFFSALAVVPATAWTLDRIADRLPQSGR